MNWSRYANKATDSHLALGADGGCFGAAYDAVRTWGGVLEHPAYSHAWHAYGLQRPKRGSWQRCPDGTWVTEVSQSAYGHRARKRTWLIYSGDRAPMALDWSEPAPTAQVSWCANHGDSPLPRLGKRTARATPEEFKKLLLALARGSKVAK